jgi:hypothetical protein
MKMRPIMMTWTDDGTMVPHARFVPLCDKQFVIGCDYPLQVVEQRSMKSHSHFFAVLHEIWTNLPEEVAKEYPTEGHLRATALIRNGWCTEKDLVCDTKAKAMALAAIIRGYAEYAVIKVSGNVVKVFDAKSQSVALMGAEDFKKSKEDVLNWASALIPGLDRKELSKAASKHAPVEKESKATPTVQAPVRQTPMPTTAPAYFAFARSWILAAKSIDAAKTRWDAERELRDDLRVSIPNRRELEKLIDGITAEIG